MQLEKETIVFDVDGVLLKWSSNLPFFALEHGIDPVKVLKAYSVHDHWHPCDLFGVDDTKIAYDLIKRYNSGKYGRYLSAYEDAVSSLYLLAKKYNIVCLTSFGVGTELWLNRKKNLEAFFPKLISHLICIDLGESKVNEMKLLMKEHKVVAFVDDQLYNIDAIKENCPDVLTVHLNRNDPDSQLKDMTLLDDFINQNR